MSLYRSRWRINIGAKCHLRLQSDCLARRLITTGMGSCLAPHSSTKHYRNSFVRHCNYVYYITRITEHWWDSRVKEIFKTQCTGITIEHMTSTGLWEAVANASGISKQKSNDAHHNYSCQGTIGIFHNGHPGSPSEDCRRQPDCAGHERLLHNAIESLPDFQDDSFTYIGVILTHLGKSVWKPGIHFDALSRY